MKKSLIVSITALLALCFSETYAETAHSAIKKTNTLSKTGRTPAKVINTILHGSGTPSSSLGINGDFYIDLLTYNMYGPKSSGHWNSPTSLKGVQGPVGPQGVAGRNAERVSTVASQTSSAGPIGPRGEKGETGAAGAAGAAGPAGPAGSVGAQGVPGPAGAAGPMGLQGEKGEQGAPGVQGPVGATGAKGDQGVSGINGATGQAGPAGPQGLTGPVGPHGLIGLTGPQGAVGPSRITYGTLSFPSPASASAMGTSASNLIIHLKPNSNYLFETIIRSQFSGDYSGRSLGYAVELIASPGPDAPTLKTSYAVMQNSSVRYEFGVENDVVGRTLIDASRYSSEFQIRVIMTVVENTSLYPMRFEGDYQLIEASSLENQDR